MELEHGFCFFVCSQVILSIFKVETLETTPRFSGKHKMGPQSVVPTSASPGSLLEMQILRPDLPLMESEMLRLGPNSLCFNKPSGGSEVDPRVRSTKR